MKRLGQDRDSADIACLIGSQESSAQCADKNAGNVEPIDLPYLSLNKIPLETVEHGFNRG